jgi:uncharacterized protein
MKVSMYTMAVHTFVPMLESLRECLDKGAAHAQQNGLDLVDARLAPDMYTLAQQVQLACHHARNAGERLTGRAPSALEGVETTLAGLQAQICRAQDHLRSLPETAFEGAEARDCSTPIANGLTFVMNGLDFLRAWALPHFYFHLVTAYDILRHKGVMIGKQDYLSQVGSFIRPSAAQASR